MIHFIISILIGGVAGWLASLIMKNANSTLVNIILGIVGGFVGRFLLRIVGLFPGSIIGSLFSGVLGACIIIALVNVLFKNNK